MGLVLAASLGKSPGVVTALVDALIKDGEEIERVVPVYVKDTKHSSGEPIEIKELIKEFSPTGPYNGKVLLDYKDSWIPGKDIKVGEEYASPDAFYKKAMSVMYKFKNEECKEVIVGIGGGRKIMSSLMT